MKRGAFCAPLIFYSLMKKRLLVCLLFLLEGIYAQAPTPMVEIKGGSYIPMYGVKEGQKKTKAVRVASFFLDVYPVTNAQYRDFLEKNPQWQRSKIKGIFAQKSYLVAWKSDLDFSPLDPEAPVTNYEIGRASCRERV